MATSSFGISLEGGFATRPGDELLEDLVDLSPIETDDLGPICGGLIVNSSIWGCDDE